MIYAQLEHLSTGWDGIDFGGPKTSIPMCGSDDICPLDGRLSTRNMIRVVREHIQKHIRKDEITGFKLFRGNRYSDSTPFTSFIKKEVPCPKN